VRRVYLAQNSGFTDLDLNLETVARRWQEVMAASGDNVIGIAAHDTSQWNLKRYRPSGSPS
jgi:hypothetical protein